MTDRSMAHPLESGCPPRWASEWGEDEFGVFAGFTVGVATQRMRCIHAGRFWMGSPEGEAGRWEREGPRHEVTLSHGYWLAETACTQSLWEAVMGSNPSGFVSADRPVENVSWEEAAAFLERLNERVAGLAARLPTEAEWEYACRAGTETSTYAGELEIEGENNGPRLEGIAWYGGNSGLEYELDEGEDSSGWPEKAHAHTKAGTHPVKRKDANPWGLYDTLGNVWEWCSDWFGDYESGPQRDPRGPNDGSFRVCRGGAWYSSARDCRAAYRDVAHPTDRDDGLGFRLARGQDQDEDPARPRTAPGAGRTG